MKILIIKTSSFGDIIQAFPVLRYIKNKIICQVDWVVEDIHSELVEAHPDIGNIFKINTKKWRKQLFSYHTFREISSFKHQIKKNHYDLVIDLQGNLKSSWVLLHISAENKVGFGWKTVPEWPNTLFTSHHYNPPAGKNRRLDYLWLVQKYFNDHSGAPNEEEIVFHMDNLKKKEVEAIFSDIPKQPITFCPSAAWENKCLSVEQIKDILKQLNDHFFLFAWGSEKEKKLVTELTALAPTRCRVLPRLSLVQLQEVMRRSLAVFAMDSLPLHLCGTTKTCSFSFFGPSNAVKYRPLGIRHLSHQGICPYNVQFEMRCPKLKTCATGACLKDLNIIKLCQQINEILR